MAINWHATLWRSLAAEARKAVRMIGNRDVKLQTAMIAVRYVVEAVRAERAVNRCRDVSRQSEKVYKLPRCLIDAGLRRQVRNAFVRTHRLSAAQCGIEGTCSLGLACQPNRPTARFSDSVRGRIRQDWDRRRLRRRSSRSAL
jgi:hypothetical protein